MQLCQIVQCFWNHVAGVKPVLMRQPFHPRFSSSLQVLVFSTFFVVAHHPATAFLNPSSCNHKFPAGKASLKKKFWQRISSKTRILLAILDGNAVIIHGHSLKGIERVVCCYENANKTSSWILTSTRRNTIWSQPESAMFCAHLSHFGYVVYLLPERGYYYMAGDEEMPKPLLVLSLLKIISLISMVYQSIDTVYNMDSII